jgi:hypothetical protein
MGVVVFGLAALAMVFMGQLPKKPTVIEAQKFALVDAAGKAVGGLSVTEEGPALAFLDETGARVALSREGLVFYGKRQQRISLYVDPRGGASVRVVTPDGKSEALSVR